MVAASWIEGGSKINSEGISSSVGEEFGGGSEVRSAVGGARGESGMVINFVLNSTEIKQPYFLLAHKISLSEAVPNQFRTSYHGYRVKIAVQTAQDGISRRVERVDELMALSHRRRVAMIFYA